MDQQQGDSSLPIWHAISLLGQRCTVSLYMSFVIFHDTKGGCEAFQIKEVVGSFRESVSRAHRKLSTANLLATKGQQSHLIGLLSLYKVHAPHLVSVNIPKIKKAFFKRKDSKWLDIVWNVRSSNNAKETRTLNNDVVISLPAAKRRRKDVIIPSSHGYPHTSRDSMQNTRITIDQITSFKDFLKHIDKLEFPNQMACVLESRFLQHFLVITRNESAELRLNFWLQQALYEELVSASSGVTRERVTKLLEALLNFISFYQKPLASVESCLAQYLLTWNGVDYQTLIFLLVSQLQIKPFQKLNDLVLEPIRKLFFCSPVEYKCQVLNCFTEMLITFARSTLKVSVKDTTQSQITSASPLSVNDLPKSNNEPRETCLVMKSFIGFVSKISAIALQLEADHVLLQHCILSFFEKVSTLHKHYPAVRFVCIPPSAIVYHLLFASNPMVVSRLCNLIVNYREAFEALKRAQISCTEREEDVLDGYEELDRFNQHIVDIADTVWRNKAFEERSKSLCYSIPRPITDALEIPHINERFSIVNHEAFVDLAKTFLVQTQEESMKLNPSLIRGKTRTVYLEFLQRQNLNGIVRFLNTFIKQKVS